MLLGYWNSPLVKPADSLKVGVFGEVRSASKEIARKHQAYSRGDSFFDRGKTFPLNVYLNDGAP